MTEEEEIRVKVTWPHIRRGKRGSPSKCPLALALREERGCERIQVTGSHVKLAKPNLLHRVFRGALGLGELKSGVFEISNHHDRGWIEDFDAGLPVPPTTFTLKRR